MARYADGPVVVIAPSERDAEDLVDDVRLFTDSVEYLPAWETLPFEHVSPNHATMAQRSKARHVARQADAGSVVVASVRSVIQRLSPSDPSPVVASEGDSIGFDALVSALVGAGYTRTDRVEARGEFAVRGGIIDVFPAQADDAVRVDFWGDEIEDVRYFSIGDQRSVDKAGTLVAYPAREFRPTGAERDAAAELLRTEPWAASTWDRIADGIAFAGLESWMPWLTPPKTFLDELPANAGVVVLDPARARDRARDLQKEESDLAEALADTWGDRSPNAGDHPPLFLDFEPDYERVVEAPPIAAGPGDDAIEVTGLDARPGDPEAVAAGLSRLRARGFDIVVAMDGAAAAQRISGVLAENGLDLPVVETHAKGSSGVLAEGVHQGVIIPSLALAVLGEREIAGRRRAHRRVGRVRRTAGEGYQDLTPGDYVVHYRHGIGRFEGLVSRSIAGVERDYLVVAYAGEDRLYVPTDQLAAVKKYTGGEQPRVSRMGGSDWEKTKTRVRREVAAVAQQVVALHRARAQATGHVFGVDSPWQREMEGAFPFEETPDQLSAIADVKADMESDKPMDRLVFGDVGFGKTEIAVRAAFKAASDGRQVAILCPTTLLAQQHYQTFSERFASYPIRVEMLSRFLTDKEARNVVEQLATGEVDVVIGTHRVLSTDIVFRDLGLLVVDEEQRFGVKAKDRIKEMRVGVDVLTLTATPIPRTLEMALTGIRDVSHIRTPPEDRHPILTYVGPFDAQAVSAAIRRELLREGQVFYVHNRIQSIDRAVAQIQELVPDARIATAHGRMSEGQLEQVMLDFWNREYDVMVATTIIESGLDLPQVNTLIVERADLLGLAQLYQLRGRVGRGSQRAYAYLFHPEEETLSEDAYRRLEAIGEFTELGSGFQLAMRDLEIRGAGSVLGEVQSGHISAVGFDLYVELVSEAVAELRGTELDTKQVKEIRIDLPLDAHLPEGYVSDQAARLEAYRRLALTETHTQVEDVAAEWEDRYGPLPPEAQGLLVTALIRVEAIRIGLSEVVKLRDEIRLAPVDLVQSQQVRLERIAPRATLKATEGAIFVPIPPREDPVQFVLGFFTKMWPAEHGSARVVMEGDTA
jgi:transcription-repair coupling factor (superfamily II helicase)